MSKRKPPYPMSKTITNVEWAPIRRIRRDALGKSFPGGRWDGSDNWPLTWADDAEMYTAYGDGFGFEPLTEEKLSMGFAKITGNYDDFQGENIRSESEDTVRPPKEDMPKQHGKCGYKASGILMVEGVLYIIIRNADRNGCGARVGVSKDHAKTWSWCDWAFEELGHPTFINFGQNYAGARDDFVYMVSHDHPSAYEASDRFVLLRVPEKRILDRDAYECFTKVDKAGSPAWSKDLTSRGAVFTHKGGCRRSGITYNPGLKRYLWWQQLHRNDGTFDTRFQGGFAFYEAPEPWGPWSTVYFTENWDVGPGDIGSFPVKWMSEDGKTVQMVFSGNDNFAVREAVLTVGR